MINPRFDAQRLTTRIIGFAPKSGDDPKDGKISFLTVQVRALMRRERLESFPFIADLDAWDENGRTRGPEVVIKMPGHFGFKDMLCSFRDEGNEEGETALRFEADLGKFALEPYDNWSWLARWTLTWRATPGQVVWLYDRVDVDVIANMVPKQLALDLSTTPDNTTGRVTYINARADA
jgi:hypothetical protein